MKISKYLTKLSIAGFMIIGMAGLQACMDDSLNDPAGKISEEELARDGFAANAFFLTLCDYAYPGGTENLYNTHESVIGDCYGRYQVLGTDKFKGANFITYNAPVSWLNQTYSDGGVMVKVYGAWNKIKNVTGGTGVKFAWAQILRIAAMQRVVDLYGALPYSQITSEQLAAPYDTMEEVYKAMFRDLTKAINDITNYVRDHPEDRLMAKYDKVYDGDYEKWVKFANSLKLRMAIRIRFANETLAREMAEEAVKHPIGPILKNEDNATSLNSKNQLYTVLFEWPDHCVAADITAYMNGFNDPRRPKYFTKQSTKKGGDEYVGMRSGLSYNNNSNGPTFSRINVGRNDRMLWMAATETAFNRAEGAMLNWEMGGTAEKLYQEGIKLSFEQWGVDGAETYLNDEKSAQANYNDPYGSGSINKVSSITIKWNDSATPEVKLERLITQKWIALWPLGQEAWSEYRRTGYPKLFPIMGGAALAIPVANRIPFPPTEYTRNKENINAIVAKLGADDYQKKVWWQRSDK